MSLRRKTGSGVIRKGAVIALIIAAIWATVLYHTGTESVEASNSNIDSYLPGESGNLSNNIFLSPEEENTDVNLVPTPSASVTSSAIDVQPTAPGNQPRAKASVQEAKKIPVPPVTGPKNPPRTTKAPSATKAPSGPGKATANPTKPTATKTLSDLPTPNPNWTPTVSLESQVTTLVNKERTKNGCAPLKVDPRLIKASQLHAQDMVRMASATHTSSDGSNMQQRAAKQGYTAYVSENISFWYLTPDDVVSSWMNPGTYNRALIVHCSFKSTGVGAAYNSGGGLFWIQMYGVE